jgi:hypothetical protein
MKEYTNQDCVQFCNDMMDAGFELEHYRGRWYWQGPAVRCDDISDVMSITKVKCQWDSMGRGVIVYPKQSDEGTETDNPKTPYFKVDEDFVCPYVEDEEVEDEEVEEEEYEDD